MVLTFLQFFTRVFTWNSFSLFYHHVVMCIVFTTFASAGLFNSFCLFDRVESKGGQTVHRIGLAELFNFPFVFSLVPCDCKFGKFIFCLKVPDYYHFLPASFFSWKQHTSGLLSPPCHHNMTATSQKKSDFSLCCLPTLRTHRDSNAGTCPSLCYCYSELATVLMGLW